MLATRPPMPNAKQTVALTSIARRPQYKFSTRPIGSTSFGTRQAWAQNRAG